MEHIATATIVTAILLLVLFAGIAIGSNKTDKEIDLIKLINYNDGFDNGFRAGKLIEQSKNEYRGLRQ